MTDPERGGLFLNLLKHTVNGDNWHTFKSPEMLAPAKIPVAAGKNMANTEKKLCSTPS